MKLPKWVELYVDEQNAKQNLLSQREKAFIEALSIAWASLDLYAKTHEGEEARKAQRAIRRLGR